MLCQIESTLFLIWKWTLFSLESNLHLHTLLREPSQIYLFLLNYLIRLKTIKAYYFLPIYEMPKLIGILRIVL